MTNVKSDSTADPQEQWRQKSWVAIVLPNTWWRLMLPIAVALLLGIGLLWLTRALVRPLALFVIGIAIAAALEPPVHWLSRRISRILAVVLVYLVILLFLVTNGWLILPRFVSEVTSLQSNVPQQIDQWQQSLNQRLPFEVNQIISPFVSQIMGTSSQWLSLPFSVAGSVFDTVLNTIVVVFISIYALIAAPAIERFLLSLFPSDRQSGAHLVLIDMGRVAGGYVRGVFIDALIVGILTYLGMWLLGINFPAALGVVAAFTEIIPIFGPLIAGVAIVFTALLQSPTLALYGLIFTVALQQFENHIITPNVMGSQTGINPLLVILAFIAGNALGGILGILAAIPLAAALKVLVERVVAPTVRQWTGAKPPASQKADEAKSANDAPASA